MTKSRDVVEVFDERSGEIKHYKLMSARIPDFLSAYPKEKGYQVKVSTTDMLHSKPGLIRLYEAAMAANMAPNQAGLPPLPDANIVIFTASLIDKEGRVLESASATRQLTGYPKEWEKGETAARQRLLAALGFGGDCFDEDEQQDIDAMNAKNQAASTSKSESSSQSSAPQKEASPSQGESADQSGESQVAEQDDSSTDAAKESQSSDDSSGASDLAVESAPKPVAKAPAKKPRKSTKQQDDDEDGVIPAHIIRQIEHQAKLKGVEMPTFKNVKEAKSELKRLMRL